MKLYGYWRSSSAWRVRIALHYKSIPFEYVPVHLVQQGGEQHSLAFRARSPLSQVPVLEWEHAGQAVRLTQSMAIVEWLEETHPKPSLMPQDSLLRARCREMAEVVNAGIQPLQNLRVLQELEQHGVDRKPWSARWIERGLHALEQLADSGSDHYCVGREPTLADLWLVPQLYNARRFSVGLSAFPTLLRIEKQCTRLDAFQAAHPDAQPDAP